MSFVPHKYVKTYVNVHDLVIREVGRRTTMSHVTSASSIRIPLMEEEEENGCCGASSLPSSPPSIHFSQEDHLLVRKMQMLI